MKASRKTQGARHEQGLRPARDDPYRDTLKAPDPAACPRCRASYHAGRWSWLPADPAAARHTCPACKRLEDNFPAGYLTLEGPFFSEHRDEVMSLVMTRAEHARLEHPMQRIIGMEFTRAGVLVTTTDAHLARRLAVALKSAYKGTLDLAFSREANLVRATWSR